MDYAKESLRLHGEWKGKIEVISRVPVASKDDLSLAYTPGVAQPCLEIQKDIEKSYDLTRRHNMVAVITDGTAVLGLGALLRDRAQTQRKMRHPDLPRRPARNSCYHPRRPDKCSEDHRQEERGREDRDIRRRRCRSRNRQASAVIRL